MNKTTLAIAIGALAASYVGLAETKISPKVSPATETPTYLKQTKPTEAPAGTAVPLNVPQETRNSATPAWLGGATPASECSSTGASFQFRPAFTRARHSPGRASI